MRKPNLVVSIILKIEVAVAFLFLSIKSIEGAFVFAVVCGCINEIIEQIYLKKKTQRQKFFFLFTSLLAILCLYFATFVICGVQFFYHRNGEIKVDTSNVWLVTKLVATAGIVLGASRLLAFAGDWLINRHTRRK